MAQEFVGMTPEDIAALPVFPEPGQADRATVQTDGGGTIVADGRGYVYFMVESNGDTGYFKVGKTVDPNTRRMNLQTGNPRELRMDPCKVAYMDAVETRVKKLWRTITNQQTEEQSGSLVEM
jgi:hypothetical protein